MPFSPFIHPKAIVELGATIGHHPQMWVFVHFIENDVSINNHVTIKNGVQIGGGVQIEDDVFSDTNVPILLEGTIGQNGVVEQEQW